MPSPGSRWDPKARFIEFIGSNIRPALGLPAETGQLEGSLGFWTFPKSSETYPQTKHTYIPLIFCPQPIVETPKKNLQIYTESTCTALMRLGEMPLPLLLAPKVGALARGNGLETHKFALRNCAERRREDVC